MTLSPSETTPATRVDGGQISGLRSNGVDRYLGVPYAAAPLGELRFRPPAPVTEWSGVRACTEHGATAPQQPFARGMERFLSSVRIPGEEFLNVAVWAPEAATAAPVIVWIHGGSFTRGSNAITAYDGTAFARSGVVLISVNYRLGAEGYSVLKGAETNLGLSDQVAALRWVRRNAAAFGGDPANITVMGESAGAISIAALLARPDAAELFDRAIMQSGPPDARPAAKSGVISTIMAKTLGIPASREAFARVTPERLLEAQSAAMAKTTPVTGGPGYHLTAGGTGVTTEPAIALAAGAGARIPVLMGCTSEEYRLWFIPGGLMSTIGWLHIAAAMLKFKISPRTVRLYRRNRPGCSTGELFGALATDLLLRLPLNRLADARLAHPGSAPTFVYEFGWRSPIAKLGACHALEIGFVFDTLDSEDGQSLAGPTAPRALATEMHAAWVAFAKNGDPGWPAWTTDRPVKLWDGEADALVHAPREDERAAMA